MERWSAYVEQIGDGPNPLVVHTLNNFVTSRGASLDLGAGDLRDSKFLSRGGFSRVVAVDPSEASRAYLVEGIELHIASIETYEPRPGEFDFIFSCDTLFHLTLEEITAVIRNALLGLRSGGIFACNVLGQDDEWAQQGREACYFNGETLTALCTGFEILETSEEKVMGWVVDDEVKVRKFWHTLRIAARKP
jgi:hypothetical protein